MKNLTLISLLILVFACKEPTEIKTGIISSDSKELADSSIQTNILPELIKKAKKGNKNLFLVFAFEQCGWCRIFEKYHMDPEVSEILLEHFIVAEIDYNKTPGGKELYRTYGSTGFPSWVILDPSGKVIISSEAPVPGTTNQIYNVGYPVGKDELDHYIQALNSTASLSTAECDLLRQKIQYYH